MTVYCYYILYICLVVLVVDFIRKKNIKYFFVQVRDDFKVLKNIYYAGAVIAVVVLSVLFIDMPMKNLMAQVSRKLNPIFSFGNYFGNGHYLLPALFLSYFIGVIFEIKVLKNIAFLSIVSALLSGIFCEIFKGFTIRSRPYVFSNPYDFFNYHEAFFHAKFFSNMFKSFPSGHTTNAFGAIVPFVFFFKKKKIIFLLLLIPVLTGFARIFYEAHWFSDIFFGAVLGSYTAVVLCKRAKL